MGAVAGPVFVRGAFVVRGGDVAAVSALATGAGAGGAGTSVDEGAADGAAGGASAVAAGARGTSVADDAAGACTVGEGRADMTTQVPTTATHATAATIAIRAPRPLPAVA